MHQPPRRVWSPRALTLLVTLLVSVVASVAPDADTHAEYPPSPFAGRTLYVDPFSPAAKDATALAASDPVAAGALEEIATRAQADWFGDWNPTATLAGTVAGRIATIQRAGAYPVLVAYNIPKRDCNSYSGGGAAGPDAYKAWIDALKAGIGNASVAVILEPDALGQLTCLTATDQQTRLALIRYAAQKLAAGGKVAVYIDAGHANWVAASVMADRLSKAGVVYARGFSLNVSNFGTTADQIAFGYKIAPAIGWKRFVVDTSRNGLGPATGVSDPWCNPPGRALGAAPTAYTGDKLVDAFLWVKHPGESDGTCNGGPAAGTWWRDYAIALALAN
jgi:endoglucanase